jgi:hypothetical protein
MSVGVATVGGVVAVVTVDGMEYSTGDASTDTGSEFTVAGLCFASRKILIFSTSASESVYATVDLKFRGFDSFLCCAISYFTRSEI